MTSPNIASNRFILLYQSSVGKKLLTGISGLALVIFVVIHMAGNLLLLVSPDAYNQYGHRLESLGPLLWGVELVLLGVVLLHAAIGVTIFVRRLQARPEGYQVYASSGTPSYQTLSSRTMIVTGAVLAAFLLWHLLTFKFGVRYQVPGTATRDLARLVIEKFRQPLYAFGYTGVMVLLASHLRHGIWSALQSLGVLNAPLRAVAYGVSAVLAVGTALGFVALPLAIYFGWVA